MHTIQATQRPNVRLDIATSSQPKPHTSKWRWISIFVVSIMLVARFGAIASAGTKLQGTKLQGTKLQGTKLQGTKLQGTKLQGTKLQGTKLQGTKLQGTAEAISQVICLKAKRSRDSPSSRKPARVPKRLRARSP